MSSKAAGWKREDLRVRLTSARSIEETGLDASTPHFSQGVVTPDAVARNMFSNGRTDAETDVHNVENGPAQRRKKFGSRSFRSSSFRFQENKSDEVPEHARLRNDKRKGRKGQGKIGADVTRENVERGHADAENDTVNLDRNLNHKNAEGSSFTNDYNPFSVLSEAAEGNCSSEVPNDISVGDYPVSSPLPNVFVTPRKIGGLPPVTETLQLEDNELITRSASISPSFSSSWHRDLSSSLTFDENASPQSVSYFPSPSNFAVDNGVDSSHNPLLQPEAVVARSRWRRLRHTVAFANRLANIKNAPNDLLEEKRVEELNEGAGGVGAAAFEGSKTGSQPRLKGRKGMEGLIVRQDKSLISFIQDFYVACLKMPFGYFLVGVFLAPVALGVLFTPIYLLNVDGLTFDEAMGAQGLIGPLASAKEKCVALLNVFLYALSLSTTFGGSPVIAVSPYCLLVANVNTLLAQFLFVFLSGAVFARMSQPSHPIRCSKRAIIRRDDYIPTLADGSNEKFRVLSIRLVLTGPPPCELVDAKICLTFRIFVALPAGSMFCSTQDLDLVRPEVSYLRYGLMVRHIIDKKSPVYGHTIESLTEGDASFSLTVMGLERTSMQPIFHLEDYFVHDGDVLWDSDYLDFIQINDKGQRVLDHSKIDLIRTFKAAGHVSQAVSRMQRDAERRAEAKKQEKEDDTTSVGTDKSSLKISPSLKTWVTSGLRNRKLWKCMSTSFTRAESMKL